MVNNAFEVNFGLNFIIRCLLRTRTSFVVKTGITFELELTVETGKSNVEYFDNR